VLDDSVTPKVVQQRIRAAAPKTAQRITFHTTRQFSRAESGDRLLEWVKAQIWPASSRPAAAQTSQNSRTGRQAIESDRMDSGRNEKSDND
jgi:hypothetical protein